MTTHSTPAPLPPIGSQPPVVTAVLWDIDGTLLTSAGAVARTFLDAVESVCGTRPSPAGLDFGGRLDPEIAALLVEAAAGRPEQVAQVLTEFEALVAERQDELRRHIQPLPGVSDLVARLAAAQVTQTVVTGNLESIGRLKLEAAGLTPPIDPALGGFGASGADRAAVARVALQRLRDAGWPGAIETSWIVGDTPRDLHCARALGVRCALVATGRHSYESLAQLDPDLVLSGLVEPTSLATAWFG